MSKLPHTLDNLCKKDREKIVEVLKQYNILKKKCKSLEDEFEDHQLESNRLQGREEILSKQLEAAQAKLYEAIELSKESQAQIEELAGRLQKIEGEKSNVKKIYQEEQLKLQKLRDQVRKIKHDSEKTLVSTSVSCKIHCLDRRTNTDDSAVNVSHQATQVSGDAFSNSVSSFNTQTTLPNFSSESVIVEQTDEDVSQLISALNQFS